MSNQILYDNLIAFHPGSYIEDIIDDLNVTQEEFSSRIGVNPKTISKLVNGEIRLSTENAISLEKITGIDFQTWMNLQNEYDKKIIEIQEKKILDENLALEKEIAKQIDISYFKKNNIIEDKKMTLLEKVTFFRKTFSLSDITKLSEFNPLVSYRNIKDFEKKSIINSNVMLEIATSIARDKSNYKLDKDKLRKSLPTIKNLIKDNNEESYPEIKKLLLDCGVILVALPHLSNSNLHGATKKFKDNSVLLLITDRNKSADIFWFSLIHEISHILDSDFYTDYKDVIEYRNKEEKANIFARNFFINEEDYKKFVEKKDFSKNNILDFSEKNNILPIMLLGRLKKDKYLDYYQFSEFNTTYPVNLNFNI